MWIEDMDIFKPFKVSEELKDLAIRLTEREETCEQKLKCYIGATITWLLMDPKAGICNTRMRYTRPEWATV